MEQLTQAPDPTFLLTIAGLAIAALLVLIIKLKVHAFASLTMVSLGTAIATGVPSEKVVSTMMGAEDFIKELTAGDCILVKASRAEHLELLAQSIMNSWNREEI